MHNYTFSPPSPPPSHHLLSTFASTFSPPSFHLHLHLRLLSIFASAVGCSCSWLLSAAHAACGCHLLFVPLVVVAEVHCLWLSTTHGCPLLMVACLPTLLSFKLLCVCVCARMCVSKLLNGKVCVKRVYCVALGSFACPPPSCLPTTTVVVQVIAYLFVPLMVVHCSWLSAACAAHGHPPKSPTHGPLVVMVIHSSSKSTLAGHHVGLARRGPPITNVPPHSVVVNHAILLPHKVDTLGDSPPVPSKQKVESSCTKPELQKAVPEASQLTKLELKPGLPPTITFDGE